MQASCSAMQPSFNATPRAHAPTHPRAASPAHRTHARCIPPSHARASCHHSLAPLAMSPRVLWGTMLPSASSACTMRTSPHCGRRPRTRTVALACHVLGVVPPPAAGASSHCNINAAAAAAAAGSAREPLRTSSVAVRHSMQPRRLAAAQTSWLLLAACSTACKQTHQHPHTLAWSLVCTAAGRAAPRDHPAGRPPGSPPSSSPGRTCPAAAGRATA